MPIVTAPIAATSARLPPRHILHRLHREDRRGRCGDRQEHARLRVDREAVGDRAEIEDRRAEQPEQQAPLRVARRRPSEQEQQQSGDQQIPIAGLASKLRIGSIVQCTLIPIAGRQAAI